MNVPVMLVATESVTHLCIHSSDCVSGDWTSPDLMYLHSKNEDS